MGRARERRVVPKEEEAEGRSKTTNCSAGSQWGSCINPVFFFSAEFCGSLVNGLPKNSVLYVAKHVWRTGGGARLHGGEKRVLRFCVSGTSSYARALASPTRAPPPLAFAFALRTPAPHRTYWPAGDLDGESNMASGGKREAHRAVPAVRMGLYLSTWLTTLNV
jgi:hypothetical protein